jgi:DNA processing protein
MSDLKYWIAINEFPQFGPKAFSRLFSYFKNMQDAFQANAEELIKAGISKKHASAFVHFRSNISPDKLIKEIEKNNITAVTMKDEGYPALLKTIYDPPGVLFVQGYLPSSDNAHLAIVGSRKASAYGIRACKMLTRSIADSGLVIVSGLAYGIDEYAHAETINAKGITVAVLACGLLSVNSSRQRYLANKIIESGGAVISEFSLHAPNMKQNFPYRNRVISGLSHATLVIEAAEKSGSLITARCALEQGRDVFALPGPIDSATSVGTNNLIKMGALAVTKSDDILDALQIEHIQEAEVPKPAPDSKEEAKILELLSKKPIHIDEITRSTQFPSHTIASTLSLMEMKGRAHQIGGMYYVIG